MRPMAAVVVVTQDPTQDTRSDLTRRTVCAANVATDVWQRHVNAVNYRVDNGYRRDVHMSTSVRCDYDI
jgi:hypothetical protein